MPSSSALLPQHRALHPGAGSQHTQASQARQGTMWDSPPPPPSQLHHNPPIQAVSWSWRFCPLQLGTQALLSAWLPATASHCRFLSPGCSLQPPNWGPSSVLPKSILQSSLRMNSPSDHAPSHLAVGPCPPPPVSCRAAARLLSTGSPLLHAWSHTCSCSSSGHGSMHPDPPQPPTHTCTGTYIPAHTCMCTRVHTHPSSHCVHCQPVAGLNSHRPALSHCTTRDRSPQAPQVSVCRSVKWEP